MFVHTIFGVMLIRNTISIQSCQEKHGVYSARHFVEWYNGLPSSSNVSFIVACVSSERLDNGDDDRL